MSATFWNAVTERTTSALASGDLQPLETNETSLTDNGLPFTVRWAATLADKPRAATAPEPTLPGGPRDPAFNPFLNPDPELTVGPLGDQHTAILNKFPVCLHHLVLARREFAEQQSPLEYADFHVLATLLSHYGGTGFYNGGADAGASQRHKHVQWVPAEKGNATLGPLVSALPSDLPLAHSAQHPKLAFAHCFTRIEGGQGCAIASSAQSMLDAFEHAREQLHLHPGTDGLLPAFNLLVESGWMLVVPRTQEHFYDASLNALSFAGIIYVGDDTQRAAVQQHGPLAALQAVSRPLAE